MAKWPKGSMFQRTQLKLTLQYCALLILLLCLFVVIVYSLVYYSIIKDESIRLQILRSNEIEFIQAILDDKNTVPIISELFPLSMEQTFYYWLNNEGNIVAGDEMQPELRGQVLSRMAEGSWDASEDVRHVTLMFRRPSEEGNLPSDPRETNFLISSQAIYQGDVQVGRFYTGKDISFHDRFFRLLISILTGIVLLFFVISLYLSHFMSRRALNPVSRMYSRQKEFLADASHELRTPLSVLLSSVEVLKMEENIMQNAFASKVLDDMKDEVKRMTRLVGELLGLARSDSNDIPLHLEWFDFRPIVEKTVHSLTPIAMEKEITIQMEMPETLVIYGDTQRLTQLLVILIDNAIKYTPRSGNVEVMVEIYQQAQKQFLSIVVTDTGVGIHPEDQELIFDRFYRKDKSRSRAVPGHGLGLSIAKWIVQISGGTIDVKSALGKGSTFTVHIPMPNE